MIPFILLTLAAAPAPATLVPEDPLPPHAVARLGTDRFRSEGSVRHLAVSRDGSRIAASTRDAVIIWDAATGRVLCHCGPLPNLGVAVSFSPDGGSVAAATWGPRQDQRTPVVIFDTATGRETSRVAGHLGGSEWVAFAGDHMLVTGGKDHLYRVWSLPTGVAIRQFPRVGHLYPKSEAVSPDGTLLACADHEDSGSTPLHVYEIATGHELVKAKLPRPARELAFAPDSRSFAVCGHSFAVEGATLRWFQLPSGREAANWQLPDAQANESLACTNDGPYMLTHSGVGITAYDVVAGKEAKLPLPAVCVANQSSAGLALWAEGIGQSVGVWDLRTGKPRHPMKPGHAEAITAAVLASDGHAVTADGCSIHRWDAAGHEEQCRFFRSAYASFGGTLTPDGRTYANTVAGGAVRVWDTESGQLKATIKAPTAPIFAPDGRTFAFLAGMRLSVLDPATGVPKWDSLNIGTALTTAAFAPGGRFIFTGDQGGTIREWDFATGKMTRQFEGHPDFIDAPAPQFVLGQPVPPQTGHTGHVMSIAVSPDGRRIVSQGLHRTIRIWEIATGKECALLDRATGQSGDYPPPPFPLAFSLDGSLLAAPGQDRDRRRMIDLWDIRIQKRLTAFDGNHTPVTALAFAPDGLRLISGASDGTGYTWQVPARPRDATPNLDESRIAQLWSELADADAAKAYRAIAALVSAPDIAVPTLRRLWLREKQTDLAAVNRMIADLNSDQYVVREKASKDLAAVGPSAGRNLRQALEKKPSAETTRRIQTILAACPDEDLRGIRAVEVLEAVGSPAARALLAEWAKGDPDTGVSREAAAALTRLTSR